MSLQGVKLYSYYRSSASYRVRIALNLKGIPFEYKAIHLVKDGGEQHTSDYKTLNPSAEIPTLIYGDHVISQSMAICLYLDDMVSENPLFSKEPFQKAKIIQACEIINSGIQPLQNLRVLQKLSGDYGFSEEQKNQWIRHWITLGFQGLEQIIKKTHGHFCFGDLPTAADAFLIPQVFNAYRFEVDMERFPNIKEVEEHCQNLEAFRMAHPDRQPDTPIN